MSEIKPDASITQIKPGYNENVIFEPPPENGDSAGYVVGAEKEEDCESESESEKQAEPEDESPEDFFIESPSQDIRVR